MACEADLQIVELVRGLFAKAVEPILRMIAEFVTVGSFEDPQQEFFVEKMQIDFTKAGSENSVKFNLDKNKVPLFLRDVAPMIFRVGCDV